MSIQELIDLNKLVFGECQPIISVFKPMGLIRPLTIVGNYDNVFLYTGCRSVLVYTEVNSGTRVFVPFDNYICFADIQNFTSDCKLEYLLPQYSLMEGFAFVDHSGKQMYEPINDPVEVSTPCQRGYFLTYPDSKILRK